MNLLRAAISSRFKREESDPFTLVYDDDFTQAAGDLNGKAPDTVNLGGNNYTLSGAIGSAETNGSSKAVHDNSASAAAGAIELQLFASDKTSGKIIAKASGVKQSGGSLSNDFHRMGFKNAAGQQTAVGGYSRVTNVVNLVSEGTADTATYVAPTPASPNAIYYVAFNLDTGELTLYDGAKSVLVTRTVTNPSYLSVRDLYFILGRDANEYGRLQVWTGADINDI